MCIELQQELNCESERSPIKGVLSKAPTTIYKLNWNSQFGSVSVSVKKADHLSKIGPALSLFL